ncbi:MAG: DNA recombination protein RmuC [Alphaproteobacteria bacterium]|nr:DNA recombination protein RmuC [Alphaproteobacteria bacterium]
MDTSLILIIILIIILAGLLYLIYSLKQQLLFERNTDKNIDLENQLRNISNDVLLNSQKNFINIAKETFDKVLITNKSDLNKKQDDFISMINPIKESLSQFNDTINAIEKERVSSYSDLRRQISDLMLFQQDIQKTTAALSKALSAPQSSGQWGEMQLRRTVELAGMIPYCDFVEQQVTDSPYSRLRPDMIIRLPGDRNIIVDAKTSLNDYMQFINTGNKSCLDEHVKHIKKHIHDLAQKSYWDQFAHTPEFVLMFLPGESFFSTAVKHDPTLVEFGIKEKVIITTPLTLIAVLKAISFTWRQEAISANAKQIGEAGRLLQSKLDKLFEGADIFSKRLYKNVEEFDKINSYIKKEILPVANKLKNLELDASLINDNNAIANHISENNNLNILEK